MIKLLLGIAMTEKTKLIIELHEIGYSTRNIAEMFDMKKNSVIKTLQFHGKLRQAPGIAIEKEVAQRLRAKRMPGDHYFDLLWQGKKIDVKSSKKYNDGSYRFMLDTKSSKKRKSNYLVDSYILVKTDTREMYLLNSRDLAEFQTMLNISQTTKYNLEPLGIV